MKTYLKTKTENTELEIDIYYHLGGMNYFTGNTQARGYYLSVSPIKVTNYGNGLFSKTYAAFSGTKILLLETTRKSEKGYQKALEFAETKKQDLINYVLNRNNIEL